MLEQSIIHTIWGIGCNPSSILDMVIRAITVYSYGILLLRIHKRFMGIRSIFNFILFVMLGSLMAGAILENRLFLPIILTVTILMLFNWLFAIALYYSPYLENLIKGRPTVLIEDGKILWHNMRKNFITKNDLLEALHSATNALDIENVEKAIFEQNGSITFKLYKEQNKINKNFTPEV